MDILKKLIKILLVCAAFVGLLYLGGYTFSEFRHEAEIKNPTGIMGSLKDKLPAIGDIKTSTTITNPNNKEQANSETGSETSEQDSSGKLSDIFGDVETKSEIEKQELPFDTPNSIELSNAWKIKVTLNGETSEFGSANSVKFVKWLANNYKDGDTIKCEKIDLTNESNTSEVTSSEKQPTSETVELVVKYNDTLEDIADLDALENSIVIVTKLDDLDYDRNEYEKPVQSYILNGHKVNRNDYAWKTSPWFDGEAFTYTCPYTGNVYTDADDKKEDHDFGNLDYDHIVPLHSAHNRGAASWDKELKNQYAYDQWVGVDVLNSANRSKSDKGPTEYLPDENVEDYCYSWLLICSKYKLVMTQEELDICDQEIRDAYDMGKSIEHLGGHYDGE